MYSTPRIVRPPRMWPRLRRTLERLLHPLYRRHAHAALRGRVRPGAMLVVCHGNICRSPFAAALLERGLRRARGGLADYRSHRLPTQWGSAVAPDLRRTARRCRI
jgi:hypothetical protein